MIDVVLPCLDEAAALPGVLAAMPPQFRPIVVDNGSCDGSADVARRLGAIVVEEPRMGYGAAVHSGLEAAETDVVCFLDADGSLDPEDLVPLAELVRDGGADLAVGRRVPTTPGVWPWHARLGNRLLAGLLRQRGLDVHDIAPARAARRTDLLDLGVRDRAFGYPLELLIREHRAGWRVAELPVRYGPRAAGTRSTVSGSMRGTARAVRDMARVWTA